MRKKHLLPSYTVRNTANVLQVVDFTGLLQFDAACQLPLIYKDYVENMRLMHIALTLPITRSTDSSTGFVTHFHTIVKIIY